MSVGNISNVGTHLRMAMGNEKQSLFLGLIGDPPKIVIILSLAIVTFLVISTVRSFWRLRHFQGPPVAAWTKLWLLRTVTSGRMHQIFYKTTKEYGL